MTHLPTRMIARTVAALAALLILIACEKPFDPASLIQSRRFLAIVAEPLEVAPGGTVVFRAVVTDANGTLYRGPIGWTVVGGDALRLEGGSDLLGDVVEQAADEPFIWQVPDREELTKRFGALEENGLLLTVAASAFASGDLFGGDLVGEPIPAFKLFVVSEREPSERWTNPILERVSVTAPSEGNLEPDENGEYRTDADKVILEAVPGEWGDRISFHWFSTESDFDPDDGAVQTFAPGSKKRFRVYCVLRNSYFFQHDDATRTRVTGIDWEAVDLRFE